MNIESEVTQNTVLDAFNERIAAGIGIKQVFDEPIPHPQFGTPIRRVRLLGNSEDTAAVVLHTNRQQGKVLEKRYPHAGNAYLEIRVENGRLESKPHLVPMRDAMQGKGSTPLPGVVRFWKGDIVCYENNDYLVGMITAYNNGRLCLVPITETCTFGELKKRGLTMRTVSGDALSQVTVIDV